MKHKEMPYEERERERRGGRERDMSATKTAGRKVPKMLNGIFKIHIMSLNWVSVPFKIFDGKV